MAHAPIVPGDDKVDVGQWRTIPNCDETVQALARKSAADKQNEWRLVGNFPARALGFADLRAPSRVKALPASTPL